MDFEHLRPTAVIGGNRFGVPVQAEVRPDLAGEVVQGGAFGEAHPQVVVHGKIKGGVERADLVPQVGAEEGGLLGDVDGAAHEAGVVCLPGVELADHRAVFVNEVGVPVHHADFGVGGQVGDGRGDSVGFVGVVGVEPRENVPGGVGKAFVEGVRLASVGFGDPPVEAVGVLLDDFEASIRRAAVGDEILDVGVGLVEDGLNGRFQVARLVE